MEKKLGRKIGHRKSLMRNLAASLVLFEKVETTEAKGKVVRGIVEKMIAVSKKQDLASFRTLLSYFYDQNAARKIYDELSKRYENRNSGFVRFYHIGNRLGDNSKMIRLELVDRKVFVSNEKKKPAETKEILPEINEKADRSQKKAQRKLDKLSATQQKGGVVTSVRTKAARKTGV